MSLIAPAVPRPARAHSARRSPRFGFSTAGLARCCALHPWRVMLAWAIVLATAGVLAQSLRNALTTEVTMTNRPESVRGNDLLTSRLWPYTPVTETVIVRSETATVDQPAFRSLAESTIAALTGMHGVVSSVTDYYTALDAGDPSAAGLASADAHPGRNAGKGR